MAERELAGARVARRLQAVSVDEADERPELFPPDAHRLRDRQAHLQRPKRQILLDLVQDDASRIQVRDSRLAREVQEERLPTESDVAETVVDQRRRVDDDRHTTEADPAAERLNRDQTGWGKRRQSSRRAHASRLPAPERPTSRAPASNAVLRHCFSWNWVGVFS